VQGGSIFKGSCLITPKALQDIDDLGALAPLHNPAHVLAIKACIKTFGEEKPQVAVFDTSFHQTMPEHVYMFALPYEYYEKYGVRKYGAHGTSHDFVSNRLAEVMGKDRKDMKIITCHLGNGCSITAVKDGKCYDTSMSFTPLDGFMMGTRTGTLDPSALTFIAEKENLSPADINRICNKESGVLGVSGVSNDNRDVSKAAAEGNHRAQLAIDMQRYQILKFVGSYIAAMNGVDAIAFTGGIGENDPALRKYVCENLGYLGIKVDEKNNDTHGEEIRISTEDSKVSVYVIPTNEELAIARDTAKIISQ
jgi:acetate kinase